MTPKTILYISKFYAPTTTAAGIRAERFVDALLQADYRVIVLTFSQVSNSNKVELIQWMYWKDKVNNFKSEIKEVKPERWPVGMMLPGPDPDQARSLALFAHGQAVLQKYQPDAVLVSAPPFSFMAVAQRLAEKFDKPLILDFRDAWFTAMPWPYKNIFRRISAQRWERRCVESADKIIVATETMRKNLVEAYGKNFADRITTVRHGYALSHNHAPQTAPPYCADRPLKMVYTGQLRGIDIDAASRARHLVQAIGHGLLRCTIGANFCEKLNIEWMSPLNFFKALVLAGKRDESFLDKIRVDFIGQKFSQIDRWTQEMGLSHVVTQRGPQSPQQAQQSAQNADLLLLSLYGIKDTAFHWCVPSKVYTYMGTGKPIMALVPPGEAADLVRNAGTGLVVHPEDLNAMSRYLREWVQVDSGLCASLKAKWEAIEPFRLAVQQEAFAKAVGEVCRPHKK